MNTSNNETLILKSIPNGKPFARKLNAILVESVDRAQTAVDAVLSPQLCQEGTPVRLNYAIAVSKGKLVVTDPYPTDGMRYEVAAI